MTQIRHFLSWLRYRLPYLNIALAVAAYMANEFLLQVFCQPVLWAALVLLASVGAFLSWPWLQHTAKGWRYGALFLQGMLLPVCAYCIWFMHPASLLLWALLSFLLVPVLAWVPVVFAVQVIKRAFTSQLPWARTAFALGVASLLGAQCWAELQYREIETAISQLSIGQPGQTEEVLAVVPRTYMAERLAGTLFKYHNYANFLEDGWRPPLHDPLVNVSLWIRGGSVYERTGARQANPLYVGSLNEQVKFYHQLFPKLPIKVDCVCSREGDGESYRDWMPGKDGY
jgi:hypothetical protein